MTRRVGDAARIYEVLTGQPPAGPSTGERFTFGVPGPYFCDRLDPGARQALDRARSALAAAGHAVRDVEIAHAAWTPDVYLHIVLPEAARFHGPLLERYADRYSPGVRMRLEMGRYLLAEDYVRAMRLRERLTAAVDRAMDRCDALLLPALPIPAPVLGVATVDVNGTAEPVRAAMLRLTQLFNMTGHPSVALPAAHDVDRLPRGLQVVGQRHRTARLLDIAAAVERDIA
jgi:aspartyl-tRNA(Asn)/glutamyl-tRNA(Gln) amidotransferase subunit A